jgi:hypothetical protein
MQEFTVVSRKSLELIATFKASREMMEIDVNEVMNMFSKELKFYTNREVSPSVLYEIFRDSKAEAIEQKYGKYTVYFTQQSRENGGCDIQMNIYKTTLKLEWHVEEVK